MYSEKEMFELLDMPNYNKNLFSLHRKIRIREFFWMSLLISMMLKTMEFAKPLCLQNDPPNIQLYQNCMIDLKNVCKFRET